MRALLVLSLLLISQFSLQAQSARQWEWGHTFNGEVRAMVQDKGFIYTAGDYSGVPFAFGAYSLPNQGGSDIFVAKWDTLGNMVWAFSIGNADDEKVVSIQVDKNHHVVMSGLFKSPTLQIGVDTLTNVGGQDLFVYKFDSSGNYLWANQLTNLNINYAYSSTSVCIDSNCNIYIDKRDYSTVPATQHLFKLNPTGSLIWDKIMHSCGIQSLTYSAFDNSILVHADFGGTYSLNGISVTATYNPYSFNSDNFIAKINVDSSLQWLVNATNSYRFDDTGMLYVNKLNGKIYYAFAYYNPPNGNTYVFSEILPNGLPGNSTFSINSAVLNTCPINNSLFDCHLLSMSGNDSLISVTMHGSAAYGGAFCSDVKFYHLVYNVLSHELKSNSYFKSGSCQIFLNNDAIYTTGTTFVPSSAGLTQQTIRSFGKLGIPVLTTTPSLHTVNLCIGANFSLSSQVQGGVPPYSYSWYPTIGLSSINSSSTSGTANNNITYLLTITDAIGNAAQDTFNLVVFTPLPPIQITSAYPYLCNDSLVLTSSYSSPTPAWLLNNSYVGFGTSHTIYQPGVYVVMLYYACGMLSDTIEILPQVQVSINATSNAVCAGDSITLTANAPTSLIYTWTDSVVNNVPFVPDSSRTYTVLGIDTNACSVSDSILIIVNPLPNVMASVSDTIVCVNEAVVFSGSGANAYSWTNGVFNNVPFVMSASQTFTVTGTDTNGCSASDSIHVTVLPLPQPHILQFSNSLVCTNVSNCSYSWMFDGSPYDTGVSISIIQNGTYIVTATDSNGCSNSDTLLVMGLALHDEVAVNNLINVYPNPNNGLLTIQYALSAAGNVSIRLTDLSGRNIRILKQNELQAKGGHTLQTDLRAFHLSNGIYFIHLKIDEQRHVIKIIYHD